MASNRRQWNGIDARGARPGRQPMHESGIDKHRPIKDRGAVSKADVYGMVKDFATNFMLADS